VQGLDRYAYVNNDPVRYTDPSGHICVQNGGSDNEYAHSGPCNGKSYVGPDEVDPSDLTTFSSGQTNYSGEMMYELYLVAWKAYMMMTGNHLTVSQFAYIILSFEFEGMGSDSGQLYVDENFINDLKTAGSIWFWCSPLGTINNCTNLRIHGGASNANILNWLGGMQSARGRYDRFIEGDGNINELFNGNGFMALAVNVGRYIFLGSSPWATGGQYLNLPNTWGNGTLFGDGSVIDSASIGGSGYSHVWNKFDNGPKAFYILTPCQSAHFKGNTAYLKGMNCPP
jgi:hypothetical protein